MVTAKFVLRTCAWYLVLGALGLDRGSLVFGLRSLKGTHQDQSPKAKGQNQAFKAPVQSTSLQIPNSLISRCRYERLMPSRFAAATLLPSSALRALTIR